MEQLSIKWNDFQSSVSKSFSSLRKEEDFFDVTLVSGDEQHISAHKVVLSASSNFFKNLLKKANHSNPMIVLSEINSRDLLKVIDYIYHGEVQLLQQNLDDFLTTARKLQIDGLIQSEEDCSVKEEETLEFADEVNPEENIDDVNSEEQVKPRTASKSHYRGIPSNTDARTAVDEIVRKIENGHECKQCGKRGSSSDIRRHAEIHIEGLSFQCPLCDKSFR